MTVTILTGCSKDSDSAAITDDSFERRVDQITEVHYTDMGENTDGYRYTTTYEWDGNKLKQTKVNGVPRYMYYYNDDRVSEILHYRNNSITLRQIFTYNENNQITQYTMSSIDGTSSAYANVSYNDNGEISSVSYINGNTTISYQLTWNNGNIIKLIRRYDSETYHVVNNYTITYDNKKSYRRGLGIEAFLNEESGFSPMALTRNNPVALHDDDDGTVYVPYTYTYDGDYVQSFSSKEDGHMYPEENTFYIKYTNTNDPANVYNITVNSNYCYVYGGGEYEYGKLVKLYATPCSSAYRFSRWSNGATANPLVFTVTGDADFYAIFEEN